MPKASAAPDPDLVIAEGELELKKGRKETKVVVRIRKPAPDQALGCYSEIVGLRAKPMRGAGRGVDAIQAYDVALHDAALRLVTFSGRTSTGSGSRRRG